MAVPCCRCTSPAPHHSPPHAVLQSACGLCRCTRRREIVPWSIRVPCRAASPGATAMTTLDRSLRSRGHRRAQQTAPRKPAVAARPARAQPSPRPSLPTAPADDLVKERPEFIAAPEPTTGPRNTTFGGRIRWRKDDGAPSVELSCERMAFVCQRLSSSVYVAEMSRIPREQILIAGLQIGELYRTRRGHRGHDRTRTCRTTFKCGCTATTSTGRGADIQSGSIEVHYDAFFIAAKLLWRTCSQQAIRIERLAQEATVGLSRDAEHDAR